MYVDKPDEMLYNIAGGELYFPLPARKWMDTHCITLFVESNHGSEQSAVLGISIIGWTGSNDSEKINSMCLKRSSTPLLSVLSSARDVVFSGDVVICGGATSLRSDRNPQTFHNINFSSSQAREYGDDWGTRLEVCGIYYHRVNRIEWYWSD